MDKTKHDLEQHHKQAPIVPHTAKWYELFGNKCPTCGAPAVIK